LDSSVGSIECLNRDRLVILPNGVLVSSISAIVLVLQQLETTSTPVLSRLGEDKSHAGPVVVAVALAAATTIIIAQFGNPWR
jgi:hypothetical protein